MIASYGRQNGKPGSRQCRVRAWLNMAAFLALATVAAASAAAQTAASRPADYREQFDRSDQAINGGRGYSESKNKGGELAWGESYVLMAYVEMHRATGDPGYLRRLVEHFDRMLKNRDDALGVKDAFAERPLAGWGSDEYSKGKWHVWLVHTGMIELGPAEFVHLVRRSKALQKEFAAKAAEYQARIEESIRDADTNWRSGPAQNEGFYFEPNLGSVQPANQQNIFGSVLLEMYGATGNKTYRDRAERLARFFRSRLRTADSAVYDWAYWPRETKDGPGSEDISHAHINIGFAARCAEARLVFTRDDMARFVRTWLTKVKRPDGTWADDVAGKGSRGRYMPYSVGLWLSLCAVAPKDLAAELYADAEHALGAKQLYGASEMPGIARLLRYARLRR